MTRLLISSRHLNTVERHAQATYPQECCGVLIGRFLDDDGTEAQVDRILAARNGCAVADPVDAKTAPTPDARRRYQIPPQTVVSAHQQARQQGLDVVGYYHSHPDHPAQPSEVDLEHAWAGLSYLIVSVREGRPKSTRSWRLSPDRRRFEEQRLEAGGMLSAG